MNRWCLLIAGTAAMATAADHADKPLDFAPHLVAAINGKKLEPRKALLHPKTLACITPLSKPLIDESLSDQFRHNIAKDYQARADAIPADRPLALGDGVVLPVRPTHQVQLDWQDGPTHVTFVAQVAYADGAWREVWPCISDAKVPAMRAANEARRQQRQRAQSLAANLSPALRKELLALLAKGERIDAIKRYQEVSKEDLATSRAVIEAIK
ncbi:MAG: hypothetical protein JO292_04970 [Betaproteobacteria bacterium]|nr:hypothetical protein [Betaproteobacteria bacterium]MBV9360721.1 hypothetical protein [Betaproteobacteria bacterium]